MRFVFVNADKVTEWTLQDKDAPSIRRLIALKPVRTLA